MPLSAACLIRLHSADDATSFQLPRHLGVHDHHRVAVHTVVGAAQHARRQLPRSASRPVVVGLPMRFRHKASDTGKKLTVLGDAVVCKKAEYGADQRVSRCGLRGVTCGHWSRRFGRPAARDGLCGNAGGGRWARFAGRAEPGRSGCAGGWTAARRLADGCSRRAGARCGCVQRRGCDRLRRSRRRWSRSWARRPPAHSSPPVRRGIRAFDQPLDVAQ